MAKLVPIATGIERRVVSQDSVDMRSAPRCDHTTTPYFARLRSHLAYLSSMEFDALIQVGVPAVTGVITGAIGRCSSPLSTWASRSAERVWHPDVTSSL